jgi:hypothetical protein
MMLTLRLAPVASGFADRQVWVDALAQSGWSGRILFSDPITVTGRLQREEMIGRSGTMGRRRSRCETRRMPRSGWAGF